MAQQFIESIRPYPNVLVYGSGLSGLSIALKLAREDINVDILQTSATEDYYGVSPGCFNDLLSVPELLKQLRQKVLSDRSIIVIPRETFNQIITAEKGFLLTTNSGKRQELQYGTIVFAPERIEQPSDVKGALNLSQLYSKLIAKERIRGRLVFLLDSQETIQSEIFRDVLDAALHLRETTNGEVWVLAKQIQVALQGQEELYDECREAGIVFIKYRDDIEVKRCNGSFELTGFENQIGAACIIDNLDLLVMPQKSVLPPLDLTFARALNIRILNQAYTQPDSLWRLPNETNRPGIFAVGASRGNMDRQAIVNDAASVVLSVKERLKPDGIPIKEHVPIVDKGKCAYCLTCVRTCPFGAMEKGTGQGRAASVNLLACQACGTCVAACPAGALQLRNEELKTQ